MMNNEQYWVGKEYKAWVVYFESKHGHDTKYVRARDKKGAIRCAKEYTFLPGRLTVSCRLASPMDLGCKPMPARTTTPAPPA